MSRERINASLWHWPRHLYQAWCMAVVLWDVIHCLMPLKPCLYYVHCDNVHIDLQHKCLDVVLLLNVLFSTINPFTNIIHMPVSKCVIWHNGPYTCTAYSTIMAQLFIHASQHITQQHIKIRKIKIHIKKNIKAY